MRILLEVDQETGSNSALLPCFEFRGAGDVNSY
jgi:hypothetical protein